MTTPEPLLARARALQLHGVVSHWTECAQARGSPPLIEWEETERARRSLERRAALRAHRPLQAAGRLRLALA